MDKVLKHEQLFMINVSCIRSCTLYICDVHFSAFFKPAVTRIGHAWAYPFSAIITYNIGFNGAETNCGIAHILGILLMNSYEIKICSEATII